MSALRAPSSDQWDYHSRKTLLNNLLLLVDLRRLREIPATEDMTLENVGHVDCGLVLQELGRRDREYLCG
jgi:hypothetical protein